jgi:retron-type reverse transcriptase
MHRLSHLIEEIITDETLDESFDYVLRGKRKFSPEGRSIVERRAEVIRTLKEDIGAGTYRITKLYERDIVERGKQRHLVYAGLYDRIALNAIAAVMEKRLHKKWIYTTAASIKERGTHFLHSKLQADLKDLEGQDVWVYKNDIRHYYDTIPHEGLKDVLRKTFRDDRLLSILFRIIDLLPQGISIGLRVSQTLGNLYLSHHLDHCMKDGCGFRFYRYCDDCVVLATSREEAERAKRVCHERMERAGLAIKPSERVWRYQGQEAIDFLGYRTFPSGKILLRKHIKMRFARRWTRVRSMERKRELIASFYGACKHATARHLFNNITDMTIPEFSACGFVFEAKDGKKRYDCPVYRLSDIVNRRVVVTDYQLGVKNKKSEDMTLVRFHFEDSKDEGKFFTKSEEMTQALQFMDGAHTIPFVATIKRVSLDGSKSYFKFL